MHAKHKINYKQQQYESFKQYRKLQWQKQVQLPSIWKCLIPNIIYEAQITSNQPNYKEKIYIGTVETDFKHRFNNHTKSFNLEHYENDTELSKEHWTIKRNYFKPKCFLCKPWTVEPDLESESKLDFNHEMSPFYFFNFFFLLSKIN